MSVKHGKPLVKLLVTGHEGQVARALARLADDDVLIVAAGRPLCDITDPKNIRRAIAEHTPDLVINTAAYTAVDRAESERDAAFLVNRDGAGYVAEAAAEAGLPVIHLSTDYVFSGDKDEPYVESDETGPLNIYGESKLAGEESVAAANPAHVILRTSWVYGYDGQNFLKTMIRLAEGRDVLRIVADQHGAPTFADDVATALLHVSHHALRDRDDRAWRGTFHMTAEGRTSWAGFAEEIFRNLKPVTGQEVSVEPIATADYPTPARRPLNSCLNMERFHDVFAHRLPSWQEGTKRCIAKLCL